MKKNLILNIATLFCKLVCFCQVLLFLFITAVLIYWHINPAFYAKFSFPKANPHHTSVGI